MVTFAHAPRRLDRTIGTLALTGVLLLGIAACANAPDGDATGLTTTAPAIGPSTPPAASAASGSMGPLAPVELTIAAGADGGPAAGRSLNLPAGWTGEVWANVAGARLAAWAPDRRLVVSTGDNGALAILTPTSAGNAPNIRTLVEGLNGAQGVAFAEQGDRDVLVVGEDTRITAFDYADGAVSNRRVLVDNLPASGHGSKAITVHDGTVFYSLGSSGNREPGDRTANPQRATVWQVSLDGTDNTVVATGVRNGFGLDVAPDGTLFVAVNQMDNLPYPFQDDTGQYGQVIQEFVNENPIEQVSRITPGTDLGWPYCVPDIRDNPDRTDIPYVNDAILNPDGQQLDCAALPNTMVGLPAHSAPLGLAFTTDTTVESALGNGALITAHGSWNRQPPRPPFVAFSPWNEATNTLGAPVELVTGFQADGGSRWGRAVAAIPGPDGSLYVTDDDAGLVYRIVLGA